MSDRLTPEMEAEIRKDLVLYPNIHRSYRVPELVREIDALRADLTASQAQVAAAFQVAAEHVPILVPGSRVTGCFADGCEWPRVGECDWTKHILALTPEPALAALDTFIQAGIDAGRHYEYLLLTTPRPFKAALEQPTPEYVKRSKS